MTPSFLRHGIKRLSAAALGILAFAAVFAGTVSDVSAAVVSRIDVEGNQRVDADTIRAYVLIQPGVEFTAQDVDDSVKALFDTGLFSDAQISQRGPILLVVVVENPVINEIAFEGNKRFKDEQLLAIIESEPGGVFTRTTVQGDVQRILELFRRSGRYQASVTPQTIQQPNGSVNLVFEIAEGPNTGVASITFIGNQAYSDTRLRSVISTRRSGILGFLRSGDQYDPDRLAADEQALREWYLNRGYADFQVISAVADLDRERNTFFITFTIEEGPRYRFGAIAVDSTIADIDIAELARLATTDEGEVFSNAAIEESTEAMTLRLAASGYPFAQVRARLDRNPVDLVVGVTYIVDEGSRNYVERIEVRGNSRTRDYVVRREFDIAEGDAFNRVLINRAERRLRNLGHFREVRITTEPGSSPDRVVVVANVVEQPTGEFSFGAGYSTSDGIVGDVSLSESNFLGRGYNMRIGAGGGSDSRNYEFSFTDPYFLGRRISAGFNVYRREYDENDFRAYDYDTTGGGVNFGFPITEDFSVQVGYNLEHQDIDIPDYDLDEDIAGTPDDPATPDVDESEPAGLDCTDDVSLAICQAEGEAVVSSVLYSLVYDSLDNRRDPHEGIYAKFTQEFAGVGGDVNFLRTTGSAAYYQEILGDAGVIGFLKVQGGHIAGLGEDVRLLDAFFKGGETVRGFESSGFGPRDLDTDDALGGTVFVAGTAEVQFAMPVVPPELGFKGAFFLDAGTLFNSDIDEEDFAEDIDIGDSATIRSSVGGSILWASPVGPIRADFAYVLTSEDYDEEQFFRIGGGARF